MTCQERVQENIQTEMRVFKEIQQHKMGPGKKRKKEKKIHTHISLLYLFVAISYNL